MTSGIATTPRVPKLGENQIGCLRSLAERRPSTWFAGCGWLWDTYSGTDRIFRSLVRHGYVLVEDIPVAHGRTRTTFNITPAGRVRAAAESPQSSPADNQAPAARPSTLARPTDRERFRRALEAIRDGEGDPRAIAQAALDYPSNSESLRSAP